MAVLHEKITVSVFHIKRMNIELEVVLRSNGLVKIEPYRCKAENLRLWTGIAKTQGVLAQTQLELNKGGQLLSVLYSLFHHNGWEIMEPVR
ncbi:MAG TPA: hypothetical protein VFT06_15240 [Flavisolibacter sp.]|nr:hypothetical protein [Flavisolibacter sp.]